MKVILACLLIVSVTAAPDIAWVGQYNRDDPSPGLSWMLGAFQKYSKYLVKLVQSTDLQWRCYNIQPAAPSSTCRCRNATTTNQPESSLFTRMNNWICKYAKHYVAHNHFGSVSDRQLIS